MTVPAEDIQPAPLASGSPTETPAEGLVPDPAQQAAPDAQPKPGEEATPKAAGDGGAREPPAWSKSPDVDTLFQHAEIEPHIKTRVEAARSEGASEGQKEAQRRMQPLLNQQHEQLQGIDGKVSGFVESWNKLVRRGPDKGGLERSEVEELLEDHKETFAALSGQHQELGKWAGANGLVYELSQALKSPELATEFQSRLGQLQRGLTDTTLFEDLGKAIASEATKPLKDELAEAKATITRLETEAKNAARNGNPPPAEPAGVGATGGGGTPKTLAEAQALHVQGKITNAQMREYRGKFSA